MRCGDQTAAVMNRRRIVTAERVDLYRMVTIVTMNLPSSKIRCGNADHFT